MGRAANQAIGPRDGNFAQPYQDAERLAELSGLEVRIDAVTPGALFQQRIAEWPHYDLGDRGFSKSYNQAAQVPSSKSVTPRDTDMFRGPKARSTFLKIVRTDLTRHSYGVHMRRAMLPTPQVARKRRVPDRRTE